MAVNPNSVIKRFYVFEDKTIRMIIVAYVKSVDPFPLDQGVEGFDTGVIVRITAVRIAPLHLTGCLAPGGGYILASSVCMNN